MATINHSDNRTNLVVSISSSGSAFRHTVKSSEKPEEVWNLTMK